MTDDAQLPNQLELVIDFVNTLELKPFAEELDSPGSLVSWLAERGLLEERPTLGEADLARALRLREALRSAVLAHNGGPAEAGAVRVLEAAAARGRLAVHFPRAESVRLEPGVGGLDGALAALLVPVAAAIADGSWSRVKACRADDCHWAFYDRSRNRSATWCEMAACGNLAKVRRYRARSDSRRDSLDAG